MILINDKEIRFGMKGVKDLNDVIPIGNWLIKYDEFKEEFFLEILDDFTMPSKIYGDAEKLSDRYLSTFKESKNNLGIVLSGLKGTGKSLTAKQTCIKSNLPVLIISSSFSGTDFNSFISSIKQECIIFIDEFEKLYVEQKDQNAILSLLDGVFMGKKLFIFTSNETSRYSNYLLNRPGRIHYMKQYERIDDLTLDEIVADNLINQTHSEELKGIINMIDEANIDMVFALVKECNMYKENPKEAVKYLNIKLGGESTYEVRVINNKTKDVYESVETFNPIVVPRYNFYVNMTDECLSRYTEEQQNGNNFLDEIQIRYNQGDYTIKQLKRDIILTNKDYHITFTPKEKFSFVF